MRRTVTIEIEVPLGGHVKRGSDGGIEVFSPLPCPVNYGGVVGERGEDGDLVDAILLGPRVHRGGRKEAQVWAVARFVDDGSRDDKLICGSRAPNRLELALIAAFLRTWARAKRLVRPGRGATAFEGIEIEADDHGG